MTTTYYRIEWDVSDESALASLCDPGRSQRSTLWAGSGEERKGVSVCASLDDLTSYFSDRAWTWTDRTAVLELVGEEVEDEEDADADEGALLIWPTRIVRILSLADAGLEPDPEWKQELRGE